MACRDIEVEIDGEEMAVVGPRTAVEALLFLASHLPSLMDDFALQSGFEESETLQ